MSADTAEIERLNRLYAALSHVRQAIVRTPSREALFERVCGALVEHGGFRMVWVGWHDPETLRLVPAASAGPDRDYLDAIEVYTDERPQGCGPGGTAFREDRAYVCNDVATDPRIAPWRGELERRGLLAVAAFPIHVAGVVAGTLCVYADRCGCFRDKEVGLLAEAASDISFALDNLAREEARSRAEEAAKRLAAIVESSDDAIFSATLEGTITSWNPAAQATFGYRADEIVGRSVELLVPLDRRHELEMIVGRVRRHESFKSYQTVRLRRDGRRFPVAVTSSPIWGPGDPALTGRELVGIAKIVRDLTEEQEVAARALREERFTSSLVESVPGVFYLYDQAGHFLRWNRAFEEVSGYSAEEIAALSPLDLFEGDDRELLKRRIAEVFSRGESTLEASLVAKDGRRTPYFLTGRRVVFDGLPCLVGVGVDISEQKRAEEALQKNEERYRRTLDALLEAGQLLDFDWRYLYLNPASELQNRRPNAELLGKRMTDVRPGIEATPVFALLRRCMEERVAVHDELAFDFADGSSAWFEVRAQPVPEGIFVLSIDITERKRAVQALLELNQTLERKVAKRTVDLDEARTRAESADRLKSAFLATMSHELRTPLNSIIGFTGIVLKEMAGPLNPEQGKQLGMVQTSARHLLDLINDVLDISKIEAGQLEMRCEPFDLLASVEQVTSSVRPQREAKGLGLRVVAPPSLPLLDSDRRRVEQILLNLVNNAIKFTERGEVTITVALATRDGEPVVRLEVSDTGIGIAARDLAVLFHPFRQVDSGLQRQHEGTGLGLAICKRLVGLLGGTVGAESVPGKGSTFTVELPLQRRSRP